MNSQLVVNYESSVNPIFRSNISGPQLIPNPHQQTINIDMDGVLVDWDGMIDLQYGYEDFKKSAAIQNLFWNEQAVSRRLFADAAPLIDVGRFIADVRSLGAPFRLLTSTGGGKFHAEIAKQKLDWLTHQGIAHVSVAFCLSSAKKHEYCHPGDILVDDYDKNCDDWEDRGGIAIQYDGQGRAMVIEEIEEALNG